jgi:hypothetical protein
MDLTLNVKSTNYSVFLLNNCTTDSQRNSDHALSYNVLHLQELNIGNTQKKKNLEIYQQLAKSSTQIRQSLSLRGLFLEVHI